MYLLHFKVASYFGNDHNKKLFNFNLKAYVTKMFMVKMALTGFYEFA